MRRFVIGALLLCAALVTLTLTAGAAPPDSWRTRSAGGVVTLVEKPSSGVLQNPLRHVPDEVLVRLKPRVRAAAAARALGVVPATVSRRFGAVDGLYHLKLAPGVGLGRAIRALRRDPNVLYAEPNFVLEAYMMPNDPSFGSQWSLANTGQTGGLAGADINAPGAWDITTGSGNVVIAVIDTGIDYAHPDLAANVFRNEADCDADGVDDDGNGHVDDCFGIDTVNGDGDPLDDEGHGTHVAGIIGAAGNDAVGIAGVAWDVSLLSCKFLDTTGTGTTAGAIACLDYVAAMKDRGVNVVASNNSWGGGMFSQALDDAISAQRQRGILFVAAAGNAGWNNDTTLTYPCAYAQANILCVAATDQWDLLAGYSNYGRGTVHLAAPGSNIPSTMRGGAYATLSGTSMAAPHVTGVVALLAAQDPARDWRSIRNVVMASGDRRSGAANTISGRRVDAHNALTCTTARLVSRVEPRGASRLVGLGTTLELSAMHVICGDPAGVVAVTVSPSGEQIVLADDGQGRDQVAGDGLYTATWTPTVGGTYDLLFPDGTSTRVDVDPHLERGFPAKAFTGSGSYHGGPAVHTLIGDIDGDGALEILATGLSSGPLYAWKADGTLVSGWPVFDPEGAAYPALGELAPAVPGLEVFAGYYNADPDLAAHTGAAAVLPGWPRSSANYVASPPTLADLDGDGVDEIITEEEDWKLHVYRADGTAFPGWPRDAWVGGQERHTSAVADLDGDGRLEIVTASGSSSLGVYLFAFRGDGTAMPGFPVLFNGYVDTYPVIGDVDGDGALEIVVAGRAGTGAGVYVFGANGVLKRTIAGSGTVFYGAALALGDLTGDGVPEIVLQTNTAVNAWHGDGTPVAGWPVITGTSTWLNNSGPVIGDVDGDGLPEIVVLVTQNSGADGEVVAYRANGTRHPAFPKRLAGLGAGAVPAIADIDADGRNEIVVVSDFWNGIPGYYDKVWVFDLGGPAPHGAVTWGQFMGGSKHQGALASAPRPVLYTLAVTLSGTGVGKVASSPDGILCGETCSTRYTRDTVVTLTASAADGARFDGWSGACAGQDNPCTVTMTADQSVTASFTPVFTLTVAMTGAGSGFVRSEPVGIACGDDCSETFVAGTSVAVAATAAPGSVFVGWGGACSGEPNPCMVAMTAERAVTAGFAPLHTLSVATAGAGTGVVESTPEGIDCGSDCADAYVSGTVVTLRATPAPGSAFGGWNGACAGQGNPCTIAMTADRSVTATFGIAVTLRVVLEGNGTGTVTSSPAGIACGADCTEVYADGTVVTLTATPANGASFRGWSGACAGTATTCVVPMEASKSVTARFRRH